MAKIGPIEYLKQVRGELRKITWPSRKETMFSTIAVMVMVTVASIFMFLADQVLAYVVRLIMGFGS